jgi:hypothetical protein
MAAIAALVLAPMTLFAQARNVVGTYNTTVNSPQGALKAVITITGAEGAYAGTLAAEGFPVMTLSKVTPMESGVSLVVDSPDGDVTVSMKFIDATKVQGTLSYMGLEMGIDGTFVAAPGIRAGTKPALE